MNEQHAPEEQDSQSVSGPPAVKRGLSAGEFARRRAERLRDSGPSTASTAGLARATADESGVVTTGRVQWRPGAVNFDLIPQSETSRSLFRLEKALPTLIWNAAALEGNTFTLPQVRTLLDGVTVGGKRLEEAEQILALSEAMAVMVEQVRAGTFAITKEMSDRIHATVARHEAIEAGGFRGEGSTTGGGAVRLAAGGTVEGDPAGPSSEFLLADYQNLLASLGALNDPRAAALVYFASATRSQFYFDGNKRTARIMMTGALLMAGYETVNIPYSRSEEFNAALDRMFKTDDATELIDFLSTCTSVDSEW